MVSLGRVAELAGVRKPKGASGTISDNSDGAGVDGTGIASGQATASVPYILEPAPISASASGSTSSSTSTVELSSGHLQHQHHPHFPHHPSYYSTHPPSSVGGAVHAIISGGATAERSASAIDLYERAIRDAEEEEMVEAANKHKQHGSDPSEYSYPQYDFSLHIADSTHASLSLSNSETCTTIDFNTT